MSNNKFEALGSDESEGDEAVNNHQQLEVSLKCFSFLIISILLGFSWSRRPLHQWSYLKVNTDFSPSIACGTPAAVQENRITISIRTSDLSGGSGAASSSGVCTATWSSRGTWLAIRTSTSSRWASSPCGKTRPTNSVASG